MAILKHGNTNNFDETDQSDNLLTRTEYDGDRIVDSRVFNPSRLTTDHSFTGDIRLHTVDSNAIGFGGVMYMAADGNLDLADSDGTGTYPAIGLAMESGTGAKKILVKGYVRDGTWSWTTGSPLYLSDTVGTMCHLSSIGTTTGDQVQLLGMATTASIAWIDPVIVLGEMA